MPPAPQPEVLLIDPSAPSWDREVLSTSGATIFHSSAWARVLTETYGHRPFYCRIVLEGRPPCWLPLMEVSSPLTGRRGVCLPFTDFCAPLGSTAHSDALFDILKGIACDRKWKHFEIRGAAPIIGAEPALTFHGHQIALSPHPGKLFETFRGAVRQGIRKAERSGVTIAFRTDEKSMADFYLLHQRTRRKHGVPPQPWRFFSAIQREVFAKGLGFLCIATHGGVPVAASVFLHAAGTAIYKFGASDPRRQELRPNNLVMWEGIRRLCELGCRTLHLGRTSLHNEGLRRYKLGWGTEEQMIHYFRFDTCANTWSQSQDRSGGLYNKVFDRMPLALNRLAGDFLYPHLD